MKAFVISCAALLNGAVFLGLSAQTPPGATTRVDPAFDEIVSPGTPMETLKSGFGFINGIVWVRESGGGHLLISDIPANVVHKWTPDGSMSAFLEKPDWTATPGRPANPRFGANGITVDPQGRIVYAAEADRAVVRLEKDGKRTVLAERFDGKRLNSPNDLVFRSDGALYFTDPSGGNRFADWDLKKELPYQGVFLLKDGKLQLVIKDLERPNGIVLSHDEKFLYVNDSVKRAIVRYEVQRDGSVANGRVFADMSAGKGTGNPDGMKFDAKGNLYSVGPGGIWVFSPDGRHLGMIVPPEFAPGFAFGDADGKSLYMAASSRLARIRVNIAGAMNAQGGGTVSLTERDKEELRLLSARYSFALATCDDKTWPELFVAPNGYFASGSRGQVAGHHRLAEMIRSYNCNYVNGVAPPHAPGVVVPYKAEFSATAGGARGVLPYNGGEYQDTYVKTPDGWRFASRTVMTNKELAASLSAADFAEIQRIAAEKVGPFEDVYEDTPVGRRFKSAGVAIELAPNGAKGTAYVKGGGHYADTYTKTPQGWRIASRELVKK